jgi:hypothetical protein
MKGYSTETMTISNNSDSSNTMVESEEDDDYNPSEGSEFLEFFYDATIVG